MSKKSYPGEAYDAAQARSQYMYQTNPIVHRVVQMAVVEIADRLEIEYTSDAVYRLCADLNIRNILALMMARVVVDGNVFVFIPHRKVLGIQCLHCNWMQLYEDVKQDRRFLVTDQALTMWCPSCRRQREHRRYHKPMAGGGSRSAYEFMDPKQMFAVSKGTEKLWMYKSEQGAPNLQDQRMIVMYYPEERELMQEHGMFYVNDDLMVVRHCWEEGNSKRQVDETGKALPLFEADETFDMFDWDICQIQLEQIRIKILETFQKRKEMFLGMYAGEVKVRFLSDKEYKKKKKKQSDMMEMELLHLGIKISRQDLEDSDE